MSENADLTRADLRLLRAYRAGDPEAAWRLLRDHGPAIHRVAFGILRDADAAADVLQETMLRVLSRRAEPDGRGLAGWLRVMAARTALNLRKSDAARALRQGRSAVGVPSPPMEPTPFLRDRITRALDALPPLQRAAFTLVAQGGLTHEEAGRALGIDANASRQNLLRARRALRERLSDILEEKTASG